METNEMKTYLSQRVKTLVVDMIQDCHKNSDYSAPKRITTEVYTIDWKQIETIFGDCDDQCDILNKPNSWFDTKVNECIPLYLEIHNALKNMSEKEISEFWRYFYWTNRVNDIKEWYNTFYVTNSEINTLVGILALSSIFERALGNIYLLRGKCVPFLLRDLLATQELRSIFSTCPIVFTQILIGTPKGLNLRNLAWHGFPGSNELHFSYVSTLFVIIASYGKILYDKNINFNKIPTRSQISTLSNHCSILQKATNFPDISQYLNYFKEEILNCEFINSIHQQYWESICDLYKNKNYSFCLLLLLSQFEHLMRNVFCFLNKCPERQLTAESDAFYTTLDEIFDEQVANNKRNAIYDYFKIDLLELYHDIYTYQKGPRIRDKLSHGEINFTDVTESFVNIVINLILNFIRELNYKFTKVTIDDFDILRLRVYETKFHPNALLKNNILKSLQDIMNWKNMNEPENMNIVLSDSIKEDVAELLKLKNIYLNKMSIDSHKIFSTVSEIKVPTICRPKNDLEVISLLRRIIENTIKISEIAQSNLKSKHSSYLNRTMRSRQRETYIKLLEALSLGNLSIECIVVIVIYNMALQFQEDDKSQSLITIKIKYLKAILQYVENFLSYIDPQKNLWEAILTSTRNMSSISLQNSQELIQIRL